MTTAEERTLAQISEGNTRAFEELYRCYKPTLYRFVYGILKSPDLANDVCQEVFIKIWEDRQRLPEVRSFKYYVLTAGKNHSLNVLKKLVSEERTLSEFLQHYESTACVSPEEELQSSEYQKFIQQTLLTLPQQSRRVFELCRNKGLSYEEVSAELGISRNIVKKHMVRSMKVLRNSVEKDLGITFGAFAVVALKP